MSNPSFHKLILEYSQSYIVQFSGSDTGVDDTQEFRDQLEMFLMELKSIIASQEEVSRQKREDLKKRINSVLDRIPVQNHPELHEIRSKVEDSCDSEKTLEESLSMSKLRSCANNLYSNLRRIEQEMGKQEDSGVYVPPVTKLIKRD